MDSIFDIIISEKAQKHLYDAKGRFGIRVFSFFQRGKNIFEPKSFSCAKVYKEIRRKQLDKFPYAIFYIPNENTNILTIYAILHYKQNPEVWQTTIDM